MFDAILHRSERHTLPLKRLIEQTGVKTSVGAIVAGSGLLALVTFYFALKATGWLLIAVPLAALMATIPVAVLKRLRTMRIRKFEEQFPEALDLIGRALRAGHAFTTGLEMVAKEMPAPVGEEFRILYDQQNYGMSFAEALKTFAERIPVLDARFFVTAVLIQRESGGNLAEVLDNLSTVIRDRFRVKRQMRVASAHGRITGLGAGVPAARAGNAADGDQPRAPRADARRNAGAADDGWRRDPSGHRHVDHPKDHQHSVLRLILEINLTLTLVAVFVAVGLFAWSLGHLCRRAVVADPPPPERPGYGWRHPRTRRARLTVSVQLRHDDSALAEEDDVAAAAPGRGRLPGPAGVRLLRHRRRSRSSPCWSRRPLLFMGTNRGLLMAAFGAVIGYLAPGMMLDRRVAQRQLRIENGLPDALDLLIVSLEAGLAFDQAILKCAEELAIAHPDVAEELRLVNVECRAGKPRIEAFKNFAARTKVDDVRALVAMLVQTDRFGTSVAQALRTHAEVSRTKRRQRAEERAAKIGVKLVFPLVFCLFPAFYVVTLGPAIIKFITGLRKRRLCYWRSSTAMNMNIIFGVVAIVSLVLYIQRRRSRLDSQE